jgi:hypothetical protein
MSSPSAPVFLFPANLKFDRMIHISRILTSTEVLPVAYRYRYVQSATLSLYSALLSHLSPRAPGRISFHGISLSGGTVCTVAPRNQKDTEYCMAEKT